MCHWKWNPLKSALSIFTNISVAFGLVLLQPCEAYLLSDCSTPDKLLVLNISCAPKWCYQSVYCCCLISYLPVRVRIATRFTNSSERFLCEVMLENEHMFCPWIQPARTCRASAQLTTAAALHSGGHWLECPKESWESPLHAVNSFEFNICTVVRDCCLGFKINLS
jgi:hypothetical protein